MDIGSFNPLKDIDIGNLINNILIFFIVLIVAVIIGGITFFLMKKKKESKVPKQSIIWWEETAESQIQLGRDELVEIIHPGTRLRAFYIKNKDMWLPRFTRSVQPGLYYVTITPQRELVNWIPTKLSEDMKKMGLKYDHTDMLWASENLREFVKRNYRDKSIKWWQAYQQVITTVIYIVILTVSFAVIIYLLRGVITDIGTIGNQLGEIIKNMETCKPTSGIVPA